MLRVEQEQLRIRPHVARVGRHEKGHIADQPHALRSRVRLQALALTEQQELGKPDLVDLARQLSARTVERSGRAADEFVWPLEIEDAVVPELECVEQGIVVEPVRLFAAEILESRAQVGARAAAEVSPCRFEQRCSPCRTAAPRTTRSTSRS